MSGKKSGTEAVDPTRSRMMASIRSAHTDPELVVRRALFHRGFRYRLNVRGLPGSPDLLLPKYQTAIMVHGCFWHRHNDCRFFRLPKTRRDFWEHKLATNAARDLRNVEALRALGWRVAVIWECATRNAQSRLADELTAFLVGHSDYIEIRD